MAIEVPLARFEACVWDHPIQPGENALAYCHRIAVLVGAIEDDEGIAGKKHAMPKPPVQREVRLPYKDPPDVEDDVNVAV